MFFFFCRDGLWYCVYNGVFWSLTWIYGYDDEDVEFDIDEELAETETEAEAEAEVQCEI